MNKTLAFALVLSLLALIGGVSLIYSADSSHSYFPSHKVDYVVEAYEGDVISLNVEKLIPLPLSYKVTFSPPFDEKGIWKTTKGDAGIYFTNVSIQIPSKNLSIVKTVRIKLKKRDSMAIIDAPRIINVKEGDVVEFGVSSSNSNSSVEVRHLPFNASFTNGFFYWRPTYDTVKIPYFLRYLKSFGIAIPFFKTYSVEFHIKGCYKKECVMETKIRVWNKNRPPVFSSPLIKLDATEGSTLRIKPNVSDADGDPLICILTDEQGRVMNNVFKVKKEDDGKFLYFIASDGLETAVQYILLHVNKSYNPFSSLPKDISIEEGEEKEFLIPVYHGLSNYSLSCECPHYAHLLGNLLIVRPGYIVKEKAIKDKAILRFKGPDKNFTHALYITLKDHNRPPLIVNYSPPMLFEALVNKPITFSLNVSDPDNDTLYIVWDIGPFNKKIINKTSIKVRFSYPGEKKITAIISDGKSKVEQEWIVDVRAYAFTHKGGKKLFFDANSNFFDRLRNVFFENNFIKNNFKENEKKGEIRKSGQEQSELSPSWQPLSFTI